MKTFFFFFFGDRLKNFCEDLFFFFGEHLRFVSLVLGLGLEHSCPWPRECLSSERLSLALASDFFCVLGLEPCVLDSTSEKNVIRSESVLNQNTVKVYTDDLKLGGRVGAGFYAEYPNNFPKQEFFLLGIYSTVFQAEVLAISEVAKTCFWKKCTIKLLLRWLIVKQLSNDS